MIVDRTSIGKVFISYSSKDKQFVRRLARRVKSDGYPVWIDEAELLPGDSLPKQVSDALVSSSVVLVVVSSAALKSRWLAFELNKATERMINGDCRVIPVVIEQVELPTEVQGLLYADFRTSFKMGYKSLSNALLHEAARRTKNTHFYQKADAAVQEVFGARSFVSVGQEYAFQDYEALSLPFGNSDGNDFDIVYESITDYTSTKEPLPQRWFDEFIQSKEQFYENIFLVTTERPIGFDCDETSPSSNRVRAKRMSKYDWDMKTVVLIDLSDLDIGEWNSHIVAAKSFIIDYVKANSLVFEENPEGE